MTPRAPARGGEPPASDPGQSGEPRDVGVLVVDDQPHFRSAARAVIDATAGFALVGEAASGEEGVRVADELAPQLVLLDVRMPGMDGIETSRQMSDRNASTVIVLVSAEDIECVPPSVASCGASALVRKEDFGRAMLRRLWRVHGRRPV